MYGRGSRQKRNNSASEFHFQLIEGARSAVRGDHGKMGWSVAEFANSGSQSTRSDSAVFDLAIDVTQNEGSPSVVNWGPNCSTQAIQSQ
jgi:hypothetical protein